MQSLTAKHWPDCIDRVNGIEVNYWASDEMPEPVVEMIMTLRQTQQARTRMKLLNKYIKKTAEYATANKDTRKNHFITYKTYFAILK